METKLVHITPDCEKLMAYCARVSSSDPENPNISGLLKYCIKNAHWSVFEMGSMCVEITTSRAIAQQILRHRSFHFQEFSQRYAAVNTCEKYHARRQDNKNRQNSIDDLPENINKWFDDVQEDLYAYCTRMYRDALVFGIAKEQARFLLPLATTTKLYMHGTMRDWITYCMVRMDKSTQREHRDIAVDIWKIMKEQVPIISSAAEETHKVLKNES